MSELLVSALPLSEQIALELHMADKTMANVRALFAAFEPPAESPFTPSELAPIRPAGGSIPFPTVEHADMAQETVRFVPTRVCKCIRHARVYCDRAGGKTSFFAECAPCNLRTPRLPTMEAAADAWNNKDVQPIRHVAPTAVAA